VTDAGLVWTFAIMVGVIVAILAALLLISRAEHHLAAEERRRHVRDGDLDPDWPPGVTWQEAALLADRDGTTVDQAARAIFRARGRAMLDGQVRRHHGRPRPAPLDTDRRDD